jgi:hypothetical protein
MTLPDFFTPSELFRKAGGRAAHFGRPFRLKLASSGHLS